MNILILGAIIGISLIPFGRWPSDLQLPDYPNNKPNIRFVWTPIYWGFSWLLVLAKGVLLPYLAYQFLDSEWFVLLAVVLTLGFHNWAPEYRLSNQRSFWVVLVGIYAFLIPEFFFLFPLVLIVTTLLSNSIAVGLWLAVAFQYIALWHSAFLDVGLIVNSIILLLVTLAYFEDLLAWVERKPNVKPKTLPASFQSRPWRA